MIICHNGFYDIQIVHVELCLIVRCWCYFNPLMLSPVLLQAIAIVLGFLVFVALIILLVFAVKTRSQIRRWGRDRILWEEVKVINDGPHNSIGEWVSICLCVCLC